MPCNLQSAMAQSTFVCLVCLAASALAYPVREPVYQQYQQLQYQQQQQPQYLQQLNTQPQYITTNLDQETEPYQGLPRRPEPYNPPPQPPAQRVSQLLLPSNVDRQIQKVAEQTAGPYYVQQVQAIQQQAQVEEAAAAARRRAQTAAIRAQQQLQAQAQAQAQAQPQPQYLREVPQQYVKQRTQPIRPSPPAPLSQEQEQEEEFDNGASYKFGFDVNDDLYTNYQNRKEQRENGKITGSYSVVDSDGYIRTVTYTADPKQGFKAEVVRQPTDIVVKIPTPAPQTKPQQHYIEEVPAPRLQQGQKQNVIYQYQ